MRTFIPILAITVLMVVIWSSFSSAFAFRPAGAHRGAQMSGSDATYGSTGKCSRGDCSGKVRTKGMAGQNHK
jgi:hypothetical protein